MSIQDSNALALIPLLEWVEKKKGSQTVCHWFDLDKYANRTGNQVYWCKTQLFAEHTLVARQTTITSSHPTHPPTPSPPFQQWRHKTALKLHSFWERHSPVHAHLMSDFRLVLRRKKDSKVVTRTQLSIPVRLPTVGTRWIAINHVHYSVVTQQKPRQHTY